MLLKSFYGVLYHLRTERVHLVEASDQRLCLLHHSSLHPPFGHSLYIILLVLLSHLEVGATRL